MALAYTYLTDKEISAKFYRNKKVPSPSTIDEGSLDSMQQDINAIIDAIWTNTSGSALTDPYGILKPFAKLIASRWLNDKELITKNDDPMIKLISRRLRIPPNKVVDLPNV